MAVSQGSVATPIDPEKAQREHYNRIAAQYEAHYDDPSTRLYRAQFIEGPMLEGIDLEGRRVLEAMCVSGTSTVGLLDRKAHVTGLDISEVCIDGFRRRFPQCDAVCASITDTGLPAASFDAVVVVGGLHHLQPNVDPGIDEIHRLLPPGGWFCFFEPHAGSVPDFFRRQWYKRDMRFARNEAAIDLEALKAKYADRFEFVREIYTGNVAFLFVYNSMLFWIPIRLKPVYTPLFLRLERMIGRLQGRRLSCSVICQWRKK